MDFNEIIPVLRDKAAAELVILFGSAANGTLRDDSDIDLAFLSEKELDAYAVFCIGQDLASLLGRDVDLIDIKKASTVLKARIIGTGRALYCSNESKKHEFQIRALKEYALLNEERKVILDRIQERGSVYEK